MRESKTRVAVVTGATSGIGLSTAVLFAKRGAKVVAAGRRQDKGEEAVEAMRQAGGEAIFVRTDVSKAADVANLFSRAIETYGRIDCAFNNAGIEGELTPMIDQTEEQWNQTIDINLKGTWLCMQQEIRQFLKQGDGGVVVNNSSVAGHIGAAGFGTYAASKHGVLGLTKSAALEVATSGIRVNAVCPAVVETPMGDRLFGEPGAHQWAIDFHPVGRFGLPREISQAVVWLCSDEASFMTGQSLILDGGMLAGPKAPGG